MRAAALCRRRGACALPATLLCALLGGVASLHGSLGAREREGALALVVLAAAMALAAWLQRRPYERAAERLALLRGGPAFVVLLAVAAVAVAAIPGGSSSPAFGANAQRLGTLGSNRYQYWRVALDTFATHPLEGAGAGGFAAAWLHARTISEFTEDAHSLELQTLAEEGLVGIAALLTLFGAVALAARRCDPARAAGPVAALVVWVVHSAVDWDWQMPALTLLAAILAGALLAWAPSAAGTGARRTGS